MCIRGVVVIVAAEQLFTCIRAVVIVITATGAVGGTGDVACVAGAGSAYQDVRFWHKSRQAQCADECPLSGVKRT
jgi:hypothetical protein